ncbi:MAG: PKD domain-containing protein [Mangrovibacterium sp.]
MKQSRVLLFIVLMFTSGFAYAQSANLEIKPTGEPALVFCKDSIRFGNMVSVTGDSILDGLKVSIANYKLNAERLECTSHSASLTENWNPSAGYLEIRGKATAEEYRQAIANTHYINLNAVPDTTTRQIAVTLIDADFLPSTGHFYKYIYKEGIKWTEARAAADTMTYRGLQGYMATITSKEENDFIGLKTTGVGWIGASDSAQEGYWRWMTGPEAGTLFWRGTASSGWAVNGAYSFWGNGEPNNVLKSDGSDEDYAHVTQERSQPQYSWNDLSNNSDGPNSQFFYSKGFIVEFGGMVGDPQLNISASFSIKIRKIIFGSKADKPICQYDSVQLNHTFNGTYSWSPAAALGNATVSNPWALPLDTTRFFVTANYDGCADTASFRVNVRPVPVFDLGDDKNPCAGDTVWLSASPESGGASSGYLWSTGASTSEIPVNASGNYWARVTNLHGCSSTDTVQVTVRDFPQITLADSSLLGYDTRSVQLSPSANKGSASWRGSAGLSFSESNQFETIVTAADTGVFRAFLIVTDTWNCESRDSVELKFYDTPSTQINIDSLACLGYSLDVNYTGTGSADALYSWYFPDTLYAEGQGLQELTIQLGFQQTNQRQLGLQVTGSGCKSDIAWVPVRVRPNVSVAVDTSEGCLPLPVRFTALPTETINSYHWGFGDGNTGETSGPEIGHNYQSPGAFDLTLTVVSAEGCSNTGVLKDFVTVNPLKTALLDIDPERCYPHQFIANYTGNGTVADTYYWDLSALGEDEILLNPDTTLGPLEISLKNQPNVRIGLQVVSDKGCEGVAQYYTLKRQPWFIAGADTAGGCAPLAVKLSAQPVDPLDVLSYFWDTGVQNDISGNPVSETYTEQGRSYAVTVIASSELTGCADTLTLDTPITVHANPVAAFGVDKTEKLISDARFQFTNESSGAVFYNWDFGDGAQSEELNPEYRYRQIGWFKVNLLAKSEFGCTDTVSYQLLVAPEDLFPPNAINPNSSNPDNRIFLLATEAVQSEGYRMQIFNRWGGTVFESTDKTQGWDGKTETGSVAPAGTYVWVLSYRDVLDKKRTQTGTVTLIF